MLCAYSAMYESVGTVDHFVSFHEDRSKAYEWCNYRYSAGWVNSSKQNLCSTDLMDPLSVEEGWFEILLPSLQLKVSDSIPSEFRQLAKDTATRNLTAFETADA